VIVVKLAVVHLFFIFSFVVSVINLYFMMVVYF